MNIVDRLCEFFIIYTDNGRIMNTVVWWCKSFIIYKHRYQQNYTDNALITFGMNHVNVKNESEK